MIKFVLDSDAVLPTRGSDRAAGMDISSNGKEQVIHPRSRSVIATGVRLADMTPGHYIRIAPRSGLSVKNSLDVAAGVVDEDYRGYIGVVLHNNSDRLFVVMPNTRIAQLIMTPVVYPEIQQVDYVDRTERGEGGFGSTG